MSRESFNDLIYHQKAAKKGISTGKALVAAIGTGALSAGVSGYLVNKKNKQTASQNQYGQKTQDLEAEKRKLSAEVSQCKQEVLELKRQNTVLAAERNQIHTKLRNYENEGNKLLAEVNKLRAEKQQTSEMLSKYENERRELLAENQNLRKHVGEFQNAPPKKDEGLIPKLGDMSVSIKPDKMEKNVVDYLNKILSIINNASDNFKIEQKLDQNLNLSDIVFLKLKRYIATVELWFKDITEKVNNIKISKEYTRINEKLAAMSGEWIEKAQSDTECYSKVNNVLTSLKNSNSNGMDESKSLMLDDKGRKLYIDFELMLNEAVLFKNEIVPIANEISTLLGSGNPDDKTIFGNFLGQMKALCKQVDIIYSYAQNGEKDSKTLFKKVELITYNIYGYSLQLAALCELDNNITPSLKVLVYDMSDIVYYRKKFIQDILNVLGIFPLNWKVFKQDKMENITIETIQKITAMKNENSGYANFETLILNIFDNKDYKVQQERFTPGQRNILEKIKTTFIDPANELTKSMDKWNDVIPPTCELKNVLKRASCYFEKASIKRRVKHDFSSRVDDNEPRPKSQKTASNSFVFSMNDNELHPESRKIGGAQNLSSNSDDSKKQETTDLSMTI